MTIEEIEAEFKALPIGAQVSLLPRLNDQVAALPIEAKGPWIVGFFMDYEDYGGGQSTKDYFAGQVFNNWEEACALSKVMQECLHEPWATFNLSSLFDIVVLDYTGALECGVNPPADTSWLLDEPNIWQQFLLYVAYNDDQFKAPLWNLLPTSVKDMIAEGEVYAGVSENEFDWPEFSAFEMSGYKWDGNAKSLLSLAHNLAYDEKYRESALELSKRIEVCVNMFNDVVPLDEPLRLWLDQKEEGALAEAIK